MKLFLDVKVVYSPLILGKTFFIMVGMLTQQDLDAIGNLIDKKLDKKFKEELKPINSKLRNLHKEMIQFRKDLNMVIKFFDNDITNVSRRVDRLEDYLHLSP